MFTNGPFTIAHYLLKIPNEMFATLERLHKLSTHPNLNGFLLEELLVPYIDTKLGHFTPLGDTTLEFRMSHLETRITRLETVSPTPTPGEPKIHKSKEVLSKSFDLNKLAILPLDELRSLAVSHNLKGRIRKTILRSFEKYMDEE